MELKPYQKQTLDDIDEYFGLYNETRDPRIAFEEYWARRGGVLKRKYDDSVEGVPRVCIKVPTGGGKTVIGLSSIKRYFEINPRKEMAVVWLVPSDAILQQTIRAFNNPDHSYRQRLNADFSARVKIVDVEEALRSQVFNHIILSDQLTIFVLSYDSLRTNNADNRRMYRENGNLIDSGLSEKYETSPIPGADLNSVIVALHDLNPYIVLDESHNARSTLSKKMLSSLGPSGILEMTATPRKDSNVITYVTASELKRYQMVKIPIILYGRYDKNDVMATAKAVRDGLERKAISEEANGGNYIRPIVLCQAQPKSGSDSETFDKVKKSLMKLGIPEEQIAIKVSSRDEIKDVNLLSRDCKIRYIITVNALKEGWDCPFAYILATIADRKSAVDVQQIVGRVLRQPYAQRCKTPVLNESFIITCSEDFSQAVKSVVESLKDEGFGKRNLEVKQGTLDIDITNDDTKDFTEEDAPVEDCPKDDGPTDVPPEDPSEDDDDGPEVSINISEEEVESWLDDAGESEEEVAKSSESAEEIEDERRKEINDDDGGGVEITVYTSRIKEEFAGAKDVVFPVFEYRDRDKTDLDGNPVYRKLNSSYLYDGLRQEDFDSRVTFDLTGNTMAKADAKDDDIQVEYVSRQQRLDLYYDFRGTASPEKSLLEQCLDQISANLCSNSIINRCLGDDEIRVYVKRVLDNCDSDMMQLISRNIPQATRTIQKKINMQLDVFRKKRFKYLVQNTKLIRCGTANGYRFKESFQMFRPADVQYAKSLYMIEGPVDGWEDTLLRTIMASENVKWVHRIVQRKEHEFYLNGYVNHYPDFIVMTKTGTLVLVEGKGPQLDGSDSEDKLDIGRTWAMMSGSDFAYLMVFPDGEVRLENAVYLSDLDKRLNEM